MADIITKHTPPLYFGVVGNRDYIWHGGQRLPFWHFLDQQPAGWLCSLAYKREDVPVDRPRIWDCGAWSYRNKKIPQLNGNAVTPQWAAEQYWQLATGDDFVIPPDHMLIPGVDLDARRAFNELSAAQFLDLVAGYPFQPMVVVHGTSIEERVATAQHMFSLGYRAFAVGGVAGIAGHKRAMVLATVEAIRSAVPADWLHVLGISAPSYAREWARLGVDSFDGASHFKQAFTAGKFYLEQNGELNAHQATRPGEAIAAPPCSCTACKLLREDGIDTRQYGSNQHNMGRAAHNLNMLIRALRRCEVKHSG